jgi:thiosulfate/3-mercaptopyruvate sulfurtransferase
VSELAANSTSPPGMNVSEPQASPIEGNPPDGRPGGRRPPGVLVGPSWLRERLGDPDLRLVDLREADAWSAGSIPGAAHLALSALGRPADGCDNVLLGSEEFEALMGTLGVTNQSLVVAYDDQWGLAAARLVWALHAYGHAEAYVLSGGWDRWVEEGSPTALGSDPSPPERFSSRVDPVVRADFEWILERVEDEETVLLDTRTPAEFAAGHAVGARSWDWFNAVPAGGWNAIRPVEELLEVWSSLGVDPDREVVVYCRSGMRAAHTYVALRHAGFRRVRLYDGSWQDWSARGGPCG